MTLANRKPTPRNRAIPPGAVWRIQAWPQGRNAEYDQPAMELRSDGISVEAVNVPGRDRAINTGTVVFDELVVGDWLHVEQMDTRQWWMAVGGLRLGISIGRDGVARVCITEDDRTPREKRGNKVVGV